MGKIVANDALVDPKSGYATRQKSFLPLSRCGDSLDLPFISTNVIGGISTQTLDLEATNSSPMSAINIRIKSQHEASGVAVTKYSCATYLFMSPNS